MTFNLRFKKNAKDFEELLDNLIHLLKTDEKEFRKTFPKIDDQYWDKILDLSENGVNRKNNSKNFTNLVIKCKKISNAYHNKIL